ncbi:MAG: fluoride efflux transporter CrcB [Candidatus Omnitrophica bacterium]|nr:fluoride efflux transporter CrcB [Candidatus Omnitrophota bacterium]
MIKDFILVGCGGALGSILRYFSISVVNRWPVFASFPWGTLTVNVLGCLIIGFLGGLASSRQIFADTGRLFFFTGVLGGFTTFSAFGLETYYLFRTSQFFFAFGNIFLQLFLGIGAVALGYWLSEFL